MRSNSETMPKISVLVPIFNVEKYLCEALDSLVQQTFQDFEVICINDGSTDHSLEIIQAYQQQDSRFCILDKTNSGYGDSMNQGLKLARGEYIAILEPDDWIENDAFEVLYHTAKKNDADIVKANYYRMHTDPKTNQPQNTKVSEITKTTILDPHTDFTVFQLSPAIWSAIYKRTLLEQNQITFLPTPGASYQDLGFQFKVFASAKKVVLLPSAFVHYRIDNQNSSINNPGKVNCVIEEYNSIEQFLMSQGTFDLFARAMSAAKFRNYHWNFQRLHHNLAKQFYQNWHQAMLVAKQQGFLQKSDFSRSHWLALQGLIHFPKLTYYTLRLRCAFHRVK